MADDWQLCVNDAKTGNFIATIRTDDSSTWSTGIAGDGTSTETIVLNDAEEPFEQGDVADMFEPNDRLISRWWGEHCMYAQKIEDYDYDKDRGTVTVTTSDLVGETDWRLIAPVRGGDDLIVTNRTTSGAIRAALARMMSFGSQWEYPIDLPADGAGPVSGRWQFWEKYRISDIIKQIEDRFGAELYFRPYGTPTTGVRFAARVGAPVTIGASTFNLDAEESPLSGVRYRVDGKRQVTGLLGLGNGSGEIQETAWIGVDSHPIPIRDTKQSFPDLVNPGLQQATDAYYWPNRSPLTQWSVGSFTISDDWSPEHASPGRSWRLESRGDLVIPDGFHQLRVIKASGGNGRVIKTEVQS